MYLQDSVILAKAKLEELMYNNIYADLMVLVKSSILNKSATDMNRHYVELLEFLKLLMAKSSVLIDCETVVFVSEPCLYSNSDKLNHRVKKYYGPVRKEWYKPCLTYESMLLPMVAAAGEAMSYKLQSYMEDYLPGGRYYENANSGTQSVLSEIRPHNDRTESIFGCNDWLCNVLPNMAQATRSVMIEFSYNKTIKWLKMKGEEQKASLTSLVQARSKVIQEEAKQEASCILEKKL